MGEPTVSQPRQDGYSIVELLVAVTVFALVFAAVSIGIGRALEVNRATATTARPPTWPPGSSRT